MHLERVEYRIPRLPRLPALALAVGLGLVGLVQLLGPADLCWVHRTTGHPCPTCGSTRAVLALVGGDPVAAFMLNPLACLALAGGACVLALRIGWRRRPVLLTTPRRVRLATIGFVVALAGNWLWLDANLPHPPGTAWALSGEPPTAPVADRP